MKTCVFETSRIITRTAMRTIFAESMKTVVASLYIKKSDERANKYFTTFVPFGLIRPYGAGSDIAWKDSLSMAKILHGTPVRIGMSNIITNCLLDHNANKT